MALVLASSSARVTRRPGETGSRPSTCSWRRTRTACWPPTDLPVLGEVAYAAGHLDVTIEAWERAHAGVPAGR